MKDSIQQHSFLVFGAGVSGRAAYALLSKLGAKAKLIEGNGPDQIEEYDILILSPGISREHQLVQKFIKQDKKVWAEVELASRFINSPILGITGSNGKTTVCLMMHDFLQRLGKKSFLAGNIGTPLSEVAMKELDGETYDFIVCELSSFQLESIENFSCLVAGIINLSFTHQERYSQYSDYVIAKSHIADNAQELFVCEDIELLKALGERKKYLWSNYSEYGFDFMKLVGEHNKANFMHCFDMIKKAGVDFETGVAQKFIEEFEGADFRIQRVGAHAPFIFYNDSKSTNIKSTIAAVECFKEKKTILIMGGKLRAESLEDFSILKDQNISKILCVGESARALSQVIKGCEVFNRLDEAFTFLKTIDEKNSTEPVHIVFSPGFPSFDHYRNYIERGEHFNQLVEAFH